MPTLSKQNITTDFLKITKLSQADFDLTHIIDNAKRYVEKRIIPESLSEAETKACEYAASAHAVYDYILQDQLSERIVLLHEGKTEYGYREASILDAAFAFRRSVFESMKDLIRDDDFIFRTMEG